MPIIYNCRNCGHPVHKQVLYGEILEPAIYGFLGNVKKEAVKGKKEEWLHFTGEEYCDTTDCPKRGCECDEPMPIRKTHRLAKWKR